MGAYPILGTIPNPIVLFDTECLLCNRTVKILLKADRKHILYYGSLTSAVGEELINTFNITEDSVVFFKNDKWSVKSTAIIEISRTLGFPYSLGVVFYGIPKWLRDFIYDYIAKNRVKWFGRTEHCTIPDEQFKNRLLY